MKNIKYTLAALALIAAASFSTAKAQNDGDVIVGVFNSTYSLAFDLGSFSSLSNGEQFNLGNVASLVTGSSKFAIIGSANSDQTSSGGITAGDVVADGNSSQLLTQAQSGELSPTESTVDTVIGSFNANQLSSQTPGTNVTKVSYQSTSSDPQSFGAQDGGNGFGLGAAAGVEQTYTGNNSNIPFYLLDANNGVLDTELPFTFSTSGNDTILTYGAVPEPSAYALGLTALALFWVLKRRNSTVA
jgi:hypothetical protein